MSAFLISFVAVLASSIGFYCWGWKHGNEHHLRWLDDHDPRT